MARTEARVVQLGAGLLPRRASSVVGRRGRLTGTRGRAGEAGRSGQQKGSGGVWRRTGVDCGVNWTCYGRAAGISLSKTPHSAVRAPCVRRSLSNVNPPRRSLHCV